MASGTGYEPAPYQMGDDYDEQVVVDAHSGTDPVRRARSSGADGGGMWQQRQQ